MTTESKSQTPYFCTSKYRYYIYDPIMGVFYKTNSKEYAEQEAMTQESLVIDLELGAEIVADWNDTTDNMDILAEPINEYKCPTDDI